MESQSRFQVFFDGDCPLCNREISWLRKRDRRQRIEFVDIAEADFDAADTGKTFDQLMAEIHGREPNGTWVTGVEVFRRLYDAAGFKRFVAVSRWPLIRHGLGAGYHVFARYRTRLTGRCTESCRIDGRQGNGENAGANTPATPARPLTGESN